MKIIDLLNKIANGEEVPNEIYYIDKIYQWTGLNYYNNKTDEYLDSHICIEDLEQYIEVIEEEKKIPEKLDYCEENTFMIKCKENSYLTREEIRLLDSNFKELGNKVNEIIDYLKSKGE